VTNSVYRESVTSKRLPAVCLLAAFTNPQPFSIGRVLNSSVSKANSSRLDRGLIPAGRHIGYTYRPIDDFGDEILGKIRRPIMHSFYARNAINI